MQKFFTVVLLVFIVFTTSTSQAEKTYRQAPQWEITEWINSPALKVEDLRGRVVIIDFFQLWCPGCNKFSIPLLQHWEQVFDEEIKQKKLAVISIHTVFEGHSYQNPQRLRRFLKQKGITHPVGVDRNIKGAFVPVTMQRYNTRGTPEMAFLDKKGRIRFQKFGFFQPKKGEALIRQLLTE